jgi:hypothetical protein
MMTSHHDMMADRIGDRAVYVLGAGFTKAFLPDAPLRVDEFGGNSLEEMFATFPVALELIRLERSRNEGGKIDIERLMSRLDGGMPFDSEIADSQVRLLLTQVKQQLFDRISAARDGRAVPELLVRFGRHCIEAKASIVTFNYDDFLDEALWRVKSATGVGRDSPYWHPDGGYGFFCRPSESRVLSAVVYMDRTTPLLKLHGSMNWRPILGARRPYMADAIVHHEAWVPRSPSAHHSNVDAIESLLEREPFIVPPVLVKSVLMEQPILRLVWSQAAAMMRAATSVAFVGYSMPVTDIAARLTRHADVRLRPADARHGMAFGATLSVEHRAQAVFGVLRFAELLKTCVKIGQLCRGQTRQWIGQALFICRAERLGVDPPLRKHRNENSCCCQQHDHPLSHALRHRLPSSPKLALLGLRVNELSSGSRKGRCRSEQAAAEKAETGRAPTRTGERRARNHRTYPPDRAMTT